jgi:hypothetical protein
MKLALDLSIASRLRLSVGGDPMTKRSFGKEAWIEMFRAVGLDEAKMGEWHHEFETQWPEAHERFLVWLGVPEPDIARIRASSRSRSPHP